MDINKYEEIDSFDNIVDTLKMLRISNDFWAKLVPTHYIKLSVDELFEELVDSNKVDIFRYAFNSTARSISYFEEIIRNNFNNNEKIQNLYSSIIEIISGSNDIALSLKHFRDSIIHVNYDLIYPDKATPFYMYSMSNGNISTASDDFAVKINSDYIDNIIPLHTFFCLRNDYLYIAYNSIKKNKIDNIDDFSNCNIKNFSVLEKKLNNVIVNDEKISSKDVEFIINYIKYIGIDYWCSLTSVERKNITKSVIMPLLNEHQFVETSNTFSMLPITLIHYSKDYKKAYKYLKCRYLYPYGYADSLFDSAFYVFNYYKTIINKSNDKDLTNELLCSDINLKGVKFIPTGASKDYNEEKNKFITTKILSTEEELIGEIEKYKDLLKKQKDDINKLENVIIQKPELVNTLSSFINRKKENIDKYNSIIEDNRNIIKNKNFSIVKQSTFFRKLRNSVSHGRYYIDFNPGFVSRNLNDSVITFWDYDEEKQICDFKVQMRADVLKRIIKEFGEKLVPYNEIYNIDEKEKELRL